MSIFILSIASATPSAPIKGVYIVDTTQEFPTCADGSIGYSIQAAKWYSRIAGSWFAMSSPTPDPIQQSYAPGSFTIPTEKCAILTRRLQLTGSQRVALQGTATLRIS